MQQKLVKTTGLTLFLALAGCPQEAAECEWTIVNSTGFEITELTVSEDLGGVITTFEVLADGETLPHGEDVNVFVTGGGAVFDLNATDIDGDTYAIGGANICVDGEALLTSLTLEDLTGIGGGAQPCEWFITNSTGFEFESFYARQDGEMDWGADLLAGYTVLDGESFSLLVDPGPYWDLQAEDVDGDTYTKLAENFCADGEDLSTTFTFDDIDSNTPPPEPCEWTITNNTGFEFWFFYAREEGASDWGPDRLGYYTLLDGESFSFMVDAGPYWDLQAEDLDGDTYTKLAEDFCLDGEDLSTTFTIYDID